jgi:hypothetical protein
MVSEPMLLVSLLVLLLAHWWMERTRDRER